MWWVDKEDLIEGGVRILLIPLVVGGVLYFLNNHDEQFVERFQEAIPVLGICAGIGIILIVVGIIWCIASHKTRNKIGLAEQTITTRVEGIIIKLPGKDLNKGLRFVGNDEDGNKINKIFYPFTDNIKIYDVNKDSLDADYENLDVKNKNTFYGRLWLWSDGSGNKRYSQIEYLRPLELTK